jgi:membrane associated rhomboid family serine protease
LFILPINRDEFVGRRPDVYIAIFVINAIVLAATYLFSDIQQVFVAYGFIPAQPQLWRVFASMFIHAGFWHFAGNMFFLWMFAYRVECTFGRWVFAMVYLLCGCGAAALHWGFNPDSTIPLGGASGAISGIAGCYLVLFPQAQFDLEIYLFRFNVKTIPSNAMGAVGIWIAEQILLGLISVVAHFSSTAFWGHIGGFATGIVLAFILLQVYPQLRKRGDEPFVVRAVIGFVFDGISKPVANARVQVSNGHTVRTTQTDNAGRFEIVGVADGWYTMDVAIDSAGFQGNLVVKKKDGPNEPMKIYLSASEPAAALAHKSSV